jgi:uncharacterized membrane protein YfcA
MILQILIYSSLGGNIDMNEARTQNLDLSVVVVANLFNLMVVGLMLARVAHIDYDLGVPLIVMAVLLIAASVFNITRKREKWFSILPLILATYLLFEWCLDYLLKIEFRSTWLLGPYLLLFYAGQMGMIGFSFLVKKGYGVVTLVTYFLSLAATAYSYVNVGHGL